MTYSDNGRPRSCARTSEAKALGIAMGEPYFKIRDLCRDEGVAVFVNGESAAGRHCESSIVRSQCYFGTIEFPYCGAHPCLRQIQIWVWPYGRGPISGGFPFGGIVSSRYAHCFVSGCGYPDPLLLGGARVVGMKI